MPSRFIIDRVLSIQVVFSHKKSRDDYHLGTFYV